MTPTIKQGIFVSQDRENVLQDLITQQNNEHKFYNKNAVHLNCPMAFTNLIINQNGHCYLCKSPAWIPVTIGNILKASDLFNDILNSDHALKIRQSIIDKSYYYCNTKICVHKQEKFNNDQSMPYFPSTNLEQYATSRIPSTITFDFDFTCNYQCPSCRTETINWNTGIKRKINNQISNKIKKIILDRITDEEIITRWAGGEPFISKVYTDLWDYIVKLNKPNIKFEIQTNGSYIKKYQDLLESMLPQISSIHISVDAATEQTYAKVRSADMWGQVIENIKLIVELKKKTKSTTDIQMDFVLQKENYHEVLEFEKLAKDLGVDNVMFTKMWNWQTWDSDTFKEMNISDPAHQDHNKLLLLLKQLPNDGFSHHSGLID